MEITKSVRSQSFSNITSSDDDIKKYIESLLPDYSIITFLEKKYFLQKMDDFDKFICSVNESKQSETETDLYRGLFISDVELKFNEESKAYEIFNYCNRHTYAVFADENLHVRKPITYTSIIIDEAPNAYFVTAVRF